MTDTLDYPVEAPANIEPVIFRAQIIQLMQLRYFNAMRGSEEPFTMGNAYDAAMATWESDWPSDPQPRTIETGLQCVDDDLSYWGEE